jgi:hypothetical protein
MCGNCAVLIAICVVLVYLLWTKQEHLEDIPITDMTADDIDKLRTYIERAVRVGQFYGDFRRMYPYTISPWQYHTMIKYRKRGELDNEAVKKILSMSGDA